MTTKKISLLVLFQLALIYIFVACISVFTPELFLLRNLTTIILMVFSLYLLFFFSDHIIKKSTRRCLVVIASFITMWIALRGAKYIAYEETGLIARHIWYMYYIPALGIPFMSLFASLSVGESISKKPRWKIRTAVLVTLILAALVLTNDLHQLVFCFRPGFENWDFDYSRAPVFYIIYAWIVLLFIGAIYILFTRCRVSASKNLIWIPMLPALFGIVYLSLYAADLWPRVRGHLFGEFPEAVCFTMAGIWLSLIYIGLIPSNNGYGRLFNISGLAAQIADSNYRVIYKSPDAAVLSKEQLSSNTDIALDANTRIHRRAVHGGFVYWKDDITKINQINEALTETREQLGEEAELLRLENNIKEERVKIEAKTRTYDSIAAKVAAQSKKITELCEQAENEPDSYNARMKMLCLLAVYIKRFANLSLISSENALVVTDELFLAVQESLRCVIDMGIPAEVILAESMQVSSERILFAYRIFEELLEDSLPALCGVNVIIYKDAVKCTFEGALPSVKNSFDAVYTQEEGNTFVKISLKEAGENK